MQSLEEQAQKRDPLVLQAEQLLLDSQPIFKNIVSTFPSVRRGN